MIQIRKMEREDIPAAVEIEQACFSQPWSEDAYNATLLLPFAHYYVAVDEERNRIVGTCGVREILGEGEVGNVAVLPAYRQQGIARALMTMLLEETTARGVQALTLEVRSTNTAAIRLYESLGFVQEGVRKNFYEKPTEDALILWRR
ncbi:MAG: ribosomal protein S18-alanine N-acetyltransferase [Lachnospiraceae bacterium]|nr:ribosomal protein S18-alanine N-acetyltransferase [Lachnospiraceae bacterium]